MRVGDSRSYTSPKTRALLYSVHQLEEEFPSRTLVFSHGCATYREAGDPDAEHTLVLLHGMGGDSASWFPVARALAPYARVIAWDAPGYGGSSPVSEREQSARHYASLLRRVLKSLGAGRAILASHSLGAMTAAAYAREYGEMTQRMMLFSPARGYGSPERAEEGVMLRSRYQRIIAGQREAQVEMESALVSWRASEGVRALIQENRSRVAPLGYQQGLALLCADDLMRHADVQVPTEIYCGADDQITPRQHCEAIANAMGTQLFMIPQAGHFSLIEQAGFVVDRLLRALAREKGDALHENRIA